MDNKPQNIIKIINKLVSKPIINISNTAKNSSINLYNQCQSALYKLERHNIDEHSHSVIINLINEEIEIIQGKITEINSKNTQDETQNTILNKIGYIPANAQITDRIYDGLDLSVKFADEISRYSSVWAWIQARIQAGNFSGIHIADYIPFTMSAGTVTDGITPYTFATQTFNARILGINPHLNFLGITTPHIDFISDACINTAIPMQPTNNNNGTSMNASPWLTSKLYSILNGVNNYTTSAYNSVAHGYALTSGSVFSLLPTALQNIIISKYQALEQRYSESGFLTVSTASAGANMGYLWVPNEFEVFGAIFYSSIFANKNALQYPLFANSTKQRLKTNSNGGLVNWWLSSAISGNSVDSSVVTTGGSILTIQNSANNIFAPLCFRVA